MNRHIHIALIVSLIAFINSVVAANTVTWTGGGGNNLWSNPDNWDSAPNLPGPGDHVVINVPGEVMFTGPPDTEVASVTVTGSLRFNTTDAHMMVAGDVSVSQTFTMAAGGSLTCDGTLTILSAMTWTGGTILAGNEVVIQPGATVSISGTTHAVLGGVMRIHGVLNQSGNTFRLGPASGEAGIVQIEPGGTFNTTGGSLALGPANPDHAIYNEGLFVRSATQLYSCAAPFHNTGVVEINSGGINFSGGGSNDGVIEVNDPAATLRLGGHNDEWTHTPSSSIVAVGTVELQASQTIGQQLLTSGPVLVNGSGTTVTFTTDRTFVNAFTMPAGTRTTIFEGDVIMDGAFTLAGGNIHVHGDLDINGTMAWSSTGPLRVNGLAVIDEDASVTLTSATGKGFVGVMENYGLVTNNSGAGGAFTLGTTGSAATFINKPGGEFVQQAGTISGHSGGPQSYFINDGLYRKINTQLSQITWPIFINEGEMLVEAGTVQCSNRPFENEGTVEVASGATFNINGGGRNAGNITGDASSTIAFGGSGVNTFIHEPGSSILANGQLTINNPPGQIVDDQITANGNMTIGATTITFLQDFVVGGNLTVTSGGNDELVFEGDLTVGGTLTKTSGNAVLHVYGDLLPSGGGTISTGVIHVEGQMTIPAGQTLTRIGSSAVSLVGTMNVYGTFNNAQTLNISTLLGRSAGPGFINIMPGGELLQSGVGGFSFGSGADPLANHITNNGTFRRTNPNTTAGAYNVPFTNNAQFLVDAGVQRFIRILTQADGVISIPAGTGLHVDFGGFASLHITGGVIEGEGTIEGPVTNTGGLVSPGFSTAVLSIIGSNGNYTQSGDGALLIEINGDVPGDEYDQLAVSGATTLGGTLLLDFDPDLKLTPDDQFQILTASSLNGSFGRVIPCDGIRMVYGPNSATVEVTGCNANSDLNCDGVVDINDLFILLAAWGECADPDDCPADLDESGEVDVNDLFMLLAEWGECQR